MDSVQHELLAGLTETWLPPEAAELEQHLEDDWASKRCSATGPRATVPKLPIDTCVS